RVGSPYRATVRIVAGAPGALTNKLGTDGALTNERILPGVDLVPRVLAHAVENSINLCSVELVAFQLRKESANGRFLFEAHDVSLRQRLLRRDGNLARPGAGTLAQARPACTNVPWIQPLSSALHTCWMAPGKRYPDDPERIANGEWFCSKFRLATLRLAPRAPSLPAQGNARLAGRYLKTLTFRFRGSRTAAIALSFSHINRAAPIAAPPPDEVASTNA